MSLVPDYGSSSESSSSDSEHETLKSTERYELL